MKLLPETLLLVTLLKRSHESKAFISYEDIEATVEKSTSTRRHLLISALKIVKQDYGYIFKLFYCQGYEPIINEAEKVKAISKKRKAKINSQSLKWREDWESINTSNLDNADMKIYIANTIQLSAQEMIVSPTYSQKAAIAAANCQSTAINYAREAMRALADVS